MQLICKASATERSCSVNRPEYSAYRSKGRLCARAATSGRRPVPLLWREPAGPGRPRGEHRRADLFFRGLPRSFYPSAAASPRGLRARGDKVCVSPAFRKTAPAPLGRAALPKKLPGKGPRSPAILLPCSPAPARPPRQERQGVRLPGFPQNRPCGFGPGILTKSSREGDQGPRAILPPCSPAPAPYCSRAICPLAARPPVPPLCGPGATKKDGGKIPPSF